MRRFLYVALVAALAWMVTIPAIGDHVIEPTAPVESVELVLWNYPDQTSVLACDGTDVVDFQNLRIETFVKVADTPSEHWDQVIRVDGVVRFNADGSPDGVVKQWRMPYKHANVPPHAGRVFESTAPDQRLTEFDAWLVTSRLETYESDRVFEDVCSFRMVD